MSFRFVDGVLVETSGPDIRRTEPGRDHSDELEPHGQGHDPSERARGAHSHDTNADDDPIEPPPPWPFGAVVAFRRRKGTTGFGQIERTTPSGLITIRTWLPCPTRTVTLLPADVRLVLDLHDLHALLGAAR